MHTHLQEILQRIAQQNNTTPDEVYKEMQIAIDAAFDNPDPQVRKNWEMINFTGDRPTPEDVIFGIGMMLTPNDGTKH